jgi:hypothetical protein
VCTLDVCRGGECVHEAVIESDACAPVRGAFQQAIGLEGVAEGLIVQVVGAAPRTAPAMTRLLTRIRDQLAGAAEALAGRQDGIASPARVLTGRHDGILPLERGGAITTNLSAEERARIAFTRVLHTPRAISSFLKLVVEARNDLEARTARDLGRRGRFLRKGTKALKAHLDDIRRRSRKARVPVNDGRSSPTRVAGDHGDADALIAGAAHVHGLTLCGPNLRHYPMRDVRKQRR